MIPPGAWGFAHAGASLVRRALRCVPGGEASRGKASPRALGTMHPPERNTLRCTIEQVTLLCFAPTPRTIDRKTASIRGFDFEQGNSIIWILRHHLEKAFLKIEARKKILHRFLMM